jgi:hypothetical protein
MTPHSCDEGGKMRGGKDPGTVNDEA